MKFREMRMVASEPFVDWVLRLENQAKFCDFEADQRKEEFTQALIRRSVPEIATKLYEMSDVFNNDLERLMAHGRHLDYIRMETEEGNQAGKVESEISGEATYGEHVVKPVNAVASQRLASRPRSSGPRLETRFEMDRPTHSRDNRFRDTEALKRSLRKVFNTYYVPKTLKADNAPPFNSVELESWLKNIWGVRLIHSTPLNPTENGLVERSMQGINKITAIAKLGKLNWKEAISDYVAAYNSWPHHISINHLTKS
nr:uncharacterized protein LOC115261060 [Aedes albopictus]